MGLWHNTAHASSRKRSQPCFLLWGSPETPYRSEASAQSGAITVAVAGAGAGVVAVAVAVAVVGAIVARAVFFGWWRWCERGMAGAMGWEAMMVPGSAPVTQLGGAACARIENVNPGATTGAATAKAVGAVGAVGAVWRCCATIARANWRLNSS